MPEVLDFGEVYVGVSARASIQVTNAGRSRQDLQLSAAAAPFTAPAELGVPGGSSAEVTVDFRPTGPGVFTSSLTIGAQTIALRGTGLAVPECQQPANPCHETTFDLTMSRCVVAPRSEGSACVSRCVTNGMCAGETCVGVFASCDDRNACTDDSCSEAAGCLHSAKQCPASPTSPCRVGVCDPLRGCEFADAVDGVRCGPKDCRARTVPVCIAAQCVDRPLAARECLAQWAYVKASNTDASDSFGSRVVVSADGNTLAIGAASESSIATGINGNQRDNSAARSGAVYVFHRLGTSWAQEAYLKPSNTAAGDAFGYALALSADGNTLAAGAHLADGAGINSGTVYVFSRGSAAWAQDAILEGANTGPGDAFGASVALSGDGATLAVGATGEDSAGPSSDESAPQAGAVYLMRRTGTGWGQSAYVKSTFIAAGDLFGFSLALSSNGSLLAVGALGEDSQATGVNGNQAGNGAPQSGAVYLFHLQAAVVSQVAFVKASNTGPADVFGISVALSTDGAVLAVGAYGEDSSANGVDGNQADNAASQSGAAYVFRSRNGLWAQEAYLKSSDTHPGADFGFSLALGDEGRALAVGAWGDTLDTGATSLFRRVGGAWAQDAYLESSNHQPGDVFGHSVSLSADAATLVCSALGEDSSARGIDGNQLDNSASDSGAVYLFTLQ